jgi:hypothetical protein
LEADVDEIQATLFQNEQVIKSLLKKTDKPLYLTVFWATAPASLAVRVIALMMEAASTSETSVKFYHTSRRSNAEDSRLQNFRN